MKRAHTPLEKTVLSACLTHLGKAVGVPVTCSQGKEGNFRLHLPTLPPVLLTAFLQRQSMLSQDEALHLVLHAGQLRETKPSTRSQAALLMAPWVNSTLAAILRDKGISYVDALGNMHLALERPCIVLDIQGRRPAVRPRSDSGRLIEPSGLKVIHLLLTDPACLALPYRTLAPRTGVSFASVGIVLRALEKAGHLVARRRRLENPDDLINLFVRGYALKLRPQLFIGRFQHPEREPEALLGRLKETMTAAGGRWALTGAAAGGRMTKYLRADAVTLFVDETSEQALRSGPFLPDPQGGNVTLLRHFAPSVLAAPAAGEDLPRATPLLVYVELLHDGRPRELETAGMIKPRLWTSGAPDGS